MNNFDPFVLPFMIGMYTLLIILLVMVFDWIKNLPASDKTKLRKGLFSIKIFGAFREIIMECFLHRRVFKVNPLLGYMHMTIAFGWFLLILGGAIESKLYHSKMFNMPWEPIFLKYFLQTYEHPYSKYLNFIMDFLLLWVLSGVFLAWFKRFYSRLFGMKKTTRLKLFDYLAMTSLWLIFPLRLIAESMTAGIYRNGGFMTNTLGELMSGSFSSDYLEYTSWWLYSIAVGIFMVSMPFSRYMHIFSEILLIALRRFGIKTEKKYTSFSAIEVYSCSRCGICIDKCQLTMDIKHKLAPSVYFISSIRTNRVKADRSFDCLICGRCNEYCPVHINTTGLRITQRKRFVSGDTNYSFLRQQDLHTAKVAYFAGCMTHLTPSIKKAMLHLFDASETNYTFIDENGGACCGRPLITIGDDKAAAQLIEFNRQQIMKTKAQILVTGCAICYKVFKDEYVLPMKIMHHSEFILSLVNAGKISLTNQQLNGVYHDPCELGRGTNIYNEPRELLYQTLNVIPTNFDKEHSLCCGGSLGNIMLNFDEKKELNKKALLRYMSYKPDLLITACPLCKKTFQLNATVPVRDIAEIVSHALVKTQNHSVEILH